MEEKTTAQMLEHLNRQMDEVIKYLAYLCRIQIETSARHENPKSELFQGIEESVLGAIPKSSENRHEDTGRKLEDYAQNIQTIRFPYGSLDRDTHEVVNADAFAKVRNQADFSNL